MTIVIRGTLPVRADKREEAIAAFIAFTAVVGDLLAGAPDVVKYEVSSFGPLHG